MDGVFAGDGKLMMMVGMGPKAHSTVESILPQITHLHIVILLAMPKVKNPHTVIIKYHALSSINWQDGFYWPMSILRP